MSDIFVLSELSLSEIEATKGQKILYNILSKRKTAKQTMSKHKFLIF